MARQPNFLLFIPDAMQGQVVRPDHDCRTPHLDRLARRGLRLNRAYTVLPTCSPARASLMTGLLPHNHGVLQVEHCVDDDQSVLRTDRPHFAQRLSQAGYHTGYFGKWHIERSNELQRFGWQVNGCSQAAAYRALGRAVDNAERLLASDSPAVYLTGPDGYDPVLLFGVTDVPTERRDFHRITTDAQQFLAEALGQDRPWACVVSFSEPNTPLIAGREAFAAYDLDAIKLPASCGDDLADRPAFYRRQRRIFQAITDRQWRQTRACYYALIGELDHQFGRLLEQLEVAGALDDTVVMVLSDHGRYMGAHGFDAHNFGAFEEAYHIPLIVAGPTIAADQCTDALVSIIDLCPTILELAAAPPLAHVDGRSLVPLLRDPPNQAADYQCCYAEYHGTRFPLMQRVLWDGPWKFIFNGFDEDELYNLADDPHELSDLAANPAHHDRVEALMAKVWQYARRTNDRAIVETHYAPMRFAAVGPNAAPLTPSP